MHVTPDCKYYVKIFKKFQEQHARNCLVGIYVLYVSDAFRMTELLTPTYQITNTCDYVASYG